MQRFNNNQKNYCVWHSFKLFLVTLLFNLIDLFCFQLVLFVFFDSNDSEVNKAMLTHCQMIFYWKHQKPKLQLWILYNKPLLSI